jgi:glycosyltransferase involved in cell wall biosynthesis
MKAVKSLLVCEYQDDLGLSSFGGVQRTEHLYRALDSLGTCDLLTFSNDKKVKILSSFNHISNLVLNDNVDFLDHVTRRNPYLLKKIRSSVIYKYLAYKSFFVDDELCNKVIAIIDSGRYDSIVSRCIYPLFHFNLDKTKVDCPIYLDIDDDPVELVNNQICNSAYPKNKLLELTKLKVVKQIMTEKISEIDHVWYTKTEDRDRYPSYLDHFSILPNIPNWKNITPQKIDLSSNEILFVGSLWWPPNKNGLFQFIKSNWNKITTACPNVQLKIVGKGLTDEDMSSLQAYRNITYLGFVDDLSQSYKSSLYTISPIYEGAGTKIKVLESLAFGRTSILSEHAFTGIKHIFDAGKSIFVENKQNSFADLCIQLLNDKSKVRKFSEHGKKIVDKHFSFQTFEHIVHQSLRELV